MRYAYEEMMDEIFIAYQPIIDLKTGEVTGEEAFCRSRQKVSPLDILTQVRTMDKTLEFDIDIHTRALKGHRSARHKKQVFLNTEQISLVQSKKHFEALDAMTEEMGVSPGDVVLEICEREYGVEDDRLADVLWEYKRAGYRLALDDADTQRMNLSCLLCCDWDYIKISDRLIHGIDKDPGKQAMVKALAMYARYNRACLIAEGVENREELETLIRMDVDFAQGYYIGRPGKAHTPVPETVTGWIKAVNRSRYRTQPERIAGMGFGNMLGNASGLKHAQESLESQPFFIPHDAGFRFSDTDFRMRG